MQELCQSLAQYKSIVDKLYPNQEISQLLQLSHSDLLYRLDLRPVGSPSEAGTESTTESTTSSSQFLALGTAPHDPYMPSNATGCIQLLDFNEPPQNRAIGTMPSTSQVAAELGKHYWYTEQDAFFPPIDLHGCDYLLGPYMF